MSSSSPREKLKLFMYGENKEESIKTILSELESSDLLKEPEENIYSIIDIFFINSINTDRLSDIKKENIEETSLSNLFLLCILCSYNKESKELGIILDKDDFSLNKIKANDALVVGVSQLYFEQYRYEVDEEKSLRLLKRAKNFIDIIDFSKTKLHMGGNHTISYVFYNIYSNLIIYAQDEIDRNSLLDMLDKYHELYEFRGNLFSAYYTIKQTISIGKKIQDHLNNYFIEKISILDKKIKRNSKILQQERSNQIQMIGLFASILGFAVISSAIAVNTQKIGTSESLSVIIGIGLCLALFAGLIRLFFHSGKTKIEIGITKIYTDFTSLPFLGMTLPYKSGFLLIFCLATLVFISFYSYYGEKSILISSIISGVLFLFSLMAKESGTNYK